MSLRDFSGDENEELESGGKVFTEFDCPNCDANNPWDEGFRSGDEVRCYYCGLSFKASVSDDNKLRFREL